MRWWLWIAVGVVGCAGDDGTLDTADATDADADTDADSDSDADTDTDADSDCTRLTEGMWSADGPAFGMAMTAMLTVDAVGCQFTLSDWDMAMDAPEGGSVSGDQVTFTGDAYWQSCTGTASSDGVSVAGACADDGAQFDLTSLGSTGM
ncbi:MAG: hypothetical protein ABMB14_31090 [Myxococcota bacterium]